MTDFIDAIKNETENRSIPKIQIDTYIREVERYGVDTIENCEEFFYQDSEYVQRFISNKTTEWHTILDCIKWISWFYRQLEYTNIEIFRLSDVRSKLYNNELKLSSEQIAEINSLYRRNKIDILNSLSVENSSQDWKCCNLDWIKRTKNQEHIVSSLIHMHVNRIFSTNQRVYECIIYNLLKKGFQTLIYKNIPNKGE